MNPDCNSAITQTITPIVDREQKAVLRTNWVGFRVKGMLIGVRVTFEYNLTREDICHPPGCVLRIIISRDVNSKYNKDFAIVADNGGLHRYGGQHRWLFGWD